MLQKHDVNERTPHTTKHETFVHAMFRLSLGVSVHDLFV